MHKAQNNKRTRILYNVTAPLTQLHIHYTLTYIYISVLIIFERQENRWSILTRKIALQAQGDHATTTTQLA